MAQILLRRVRRSWQKNRARQVRRYRDISFEPLEGRLMLAIAAPAWTPLGPAPILGGQTPDLDPVTGRVTGIAAHPTNPNTIYIASGTGGVWKTENAGTHWTPLTDQEETLAMGAIAIAPSNSNILYAGTGEPGYHGSSRDGLGVLKSIDAGVTWTLSKGNSGQDEFAGYRISRVIVHPTDPDIVYIAVSNGPNFEEVGIWKTVDGGSTWTNTTKDDLSDVEHTDYSDLVMDPSDPNVLYAAVTSLGGSSLGGIYKSENAGGDWSLLGGGLPSGDTVGWTKLAVAPTDHNVVYVAIAGTGTSGSAVRSHLFKFMKSVDAGVNWSDLTNNPVTGCNSDELKTMLECDYLGNQGDKNATLAVDPTNPNIVYAAGTGFVVVSRDGGANWLEIGDISASPGLGRHGPHADHHAIGFDANHKMLDGNDGGLWRLNDNTEANYNWTDINGDLSITQFYDIALDPTNRKIAYGSSQDNGTEKYTGLLAWNWFGAGGDGNRVLVDPTNPQTIYVQNNGPFRRSDDGGVTLNEKVNGLTGSLGSVEMDPSNSSHLFASTSDGLFETIDKAENWTQIGVPGQNGFPADPVIRLAIALDGTTIYGSLVGDPKDFMVSSDGGHHWTVHGTGFNNFIDGGLAVDPADKKIVYGTRLTTGTGKSGTSVIRSKDGGVTWSAFIGSGAGQLPDVFVRSVAVGKNIVYVGTEIGVYATTDNGANWFRFGTGLPNVEIDDLELNTDLNVLAAGTFGRGMWTITPTGDQIGVHRATNFYLDLNRNRTWDSALRGDGLASFGMVGDTALVGDWNGDGVDEIGVHRGRYFYLDLNGNGLWDGIGTDKVIAYGTNGDVPLVGDWNGDGVDDVGVYRARWFYLDSNGNGRWDGIGTDKVVVFGTSGDVPVVGDWNGDRVDDVGVHRGNRWYLDLNGDGRWNGTGIDGDFSFGISGDEAVVGDWNGDGKDDLGVHRGSQWYVDVNGNRQWDGVGKDLNFKFGYVEDDAIVGKFGTLALTAQGQPSATSIDQQASIVLDLNDDLPPWQNYFNPYDVGQDSQVSPLDALVVINLLNSQRLPESGLLSPPTLDNQPSPYYDVSGDGYATPLDVLQIINYLNSPGFSGEGEAEQPIAYADSFPHGIDDAMNDYLAESLADSDVLRNAVATNTTGQSPAAGGISANNGTILWQFIKSESNQLGRTKNRKPADPSPTLIDSELLDLLATDGTKETIP